MRPYIRKKALEVTEDPNTGQERILESEEHEDTYSDQKSFDTLDVRHRYIRDCGCDGPVGGRCHECGAISCTSCHGRCHSCQKPVCLEHSNFMQAESKESIRLCHRCYDAVNRKKLLARALNFVLSLFTEEEMNES